MKKLLLGTCAAAALLCSQSSVAAPVLGAQLYYTGGDVTVEVLAPTAAYTSTLSLYLIGTDVASFGTNHDVVRIPAKLNSDSGQREHRSS